MTFTKRETSLDAVSANADGTAVDADGATMFTLFVRTPAALDTASGDTLTVTLQATVDGSEWFDLSTSIDETGLTAQTGGEYTAGAFATDVPVQQVRAVLSNFSDFANADLTVTAKIFAAEV